MKLLLLLLLSSQLFAQVKPLAKRSDGTVYITNATYQPGDTIQLEGDYLWIQLRPLNGTKERPIVIRNKPGTKVTIGGFKAYTLHIVGKHVKVIGDTIGNLVIGKKGGPYSMGFNPGGSTNIEVANVEFQNLATGIQQNPIGTTVLEDCYYHDNYFHDLNNPGADMGRSEAFYLGQTSTGGMTFKNCRIENNRIENVSGDGIQVAGGTFTIKNNKINNYGTANLRYQNNGILVGGYATADVINNEVSNGTGIALQILGRGLMDVISNKFTNIDTRTHGDDIVYINGKTATPDNKLRINFHGNTFSGLLPGRKVIFNGTSSTLNGGIMYLGNIGVLQKDIVFVNPDTLITVPPPQPPAKLFELTSSTGEKVVFQLIDSTLKVKK